MDKSEEQKTDGAPAGPAAQTGKVPLESTASPATKTPTASSVKPPVKKKEEGPKPQDAGAHPLVGKIKKRFADSVIEATEFLGQLSVTLAPARLKEVCRFLLDDEETRFNYLSDLTCVHYPERSTAPFEVVYNLYSIPHNTRLRLKVGTVTGGEVESVTEIWPAANWMEREVYDLFGVVFLHHPDLRRILLPADWEGHPLRKDYPLEFVENNWTQKHLPEFTDVEREQLEQRRAYGLEALSHPDERRTREIFRAGREPMPLDKR